MEIVFLDTSAGEQYPGVWCKCENCQKARRLGGHNIRRNSCAWLSPDCLIDFTPEVFIQCDRFGVPIVDAKYLLVTHSHEDHFYPVMLGWRYMSPKITLPPKQTESGPRFSDLEFLRLYGNKDVCDWVMKCVGKRLNECRMEVNQIEPFRPYDLGSMRIMALLGNHQDRTVKAYNYIIERDGRTILYALDTGWFLPESLAEIEKHRFDLAVIEGTFGYGAESEGHFNFRKLLEAHKLFQERGLLKPSGIFCVTHLCPHWSPVHDEIAPVLGQKGITVAYDGMRVPL